MFKLEIAIVNAIHNVLFETEGDAVTQLRLLEQKMGRQYYGRNGEDDPTHTVNNPTGDLVVVCDKVQSARVIDIAMYERMVAPLDEAVIQRDIDISVRKKTALSSISAATPPHPSGAG